MKSQDWQPCRACIMVVIRTSWNEDSSINRTHLVVPNTLSVQPLDSGRLTDKDTFCPKGVHIGEVPLYWQPATNNKHVCLLFVFRSTEDGYTPAAHVEQLQEATVGVVKDLCNGYIQLHHHYLDPANRSHDHAQLVTWSSHENCLQHNYIIYSHIFGKGIMIVQKISKDHNYIMGEW